MIATKTRRTLLALLAAIAISTPTLVHAAIYRCVDQGRVSYSDRPCEGGVIVGTANIALAQSSVDALARPSEPIQDSHSDAAESIADRGIVGMSAQHVFATLGRPQRMSMTLERGLVTERWTYRAAQRRTDVLFRLGRVTEVTSR
jgi:hypothetical protein